MNPISLCLTLSNDSSIAFSPSSCEKYYEKVLKKIIAFLYSHPSFKFSFSFSGLQLQWLKLYRPQFIQAVKELYSRKQIELIGGGFYNPIFPLIYPQDRTGQIELLSSEIKNLSGKRPYGISLGCSVWSNSLISTFSGCSMDYVLLDSSLVSSQKQNFLPLILHETGKSIKALCVYNESSKLASGNKSIDDIISQFIKKIDAKERKSKISESFFSQGEIEQSRVISLNFDQSSFEILIRNNFLQDLDALLNSKYLGKIELSLPQDYIKSSKTFIPTYINAGMSRDIEKWASVPYTEVINKTGFPLTIFDFLEKYKRNKALYDRMIYVSMLINQCYGDKQRKKNARDLLWAAQNADAYVCTPDGIFSNSQMRQNAYKNLAEAEKILRNLENDDEEKFKESVSAFDYNGDGTNEYVCRMEKYNACFSLVGGYCFELDIMKNSGNYADNFSRLEKYDEITDNYERGLFIEHLFTEDEFKSYKKGNPSGTGIFSRVKFEQKKFDQKKKEIHLVGKGNFSSEKLSVTLLKKIIATSDGFTIQYILRNESNRKVKGVFVSESNFAQTDFTSAEKNSYSVEVIKNGEKSVPVIEKKGFALEDISYAKVKDAANQIAFIFEPNEDAKLCCMPLTFRRPKSTKQLSTAGTTFVTSICWDIDLDAGKEMEKFISFNIVFASKD